MENIDESDSTKDIDYLNLIRLNQRYIVLGLLLEGKTKK
jgi:hypothetical protein